MDRCMTVAPDVERFASERGLTVETKGGFWYTRKP